MIILVCTNYYGRKILFGEEADTMHGSCLTLPFWTKVISYLKVKRTPDAMRSRYSRIVSHVHPKEYD